MDLAFSPTLLSASIVIGGTLLATFLRCGASNCAAAIGAVATIGRTRFDADRVQGEMAAQVREIQRDGMLRAHPHHTGDREFDEGADALIGRRSVKALLEAHAKHKATRAAEDGRAISTLAQAAELAPVFGLAGTLVSLGQLPADGIAKGAYAGAISMAVQTTLFGLLLANLLFAPLAKAVERKAEGEEHERQKVVDWLTGHLSPEAARNPRAHMEEAA
jgi:chemotaxis protein MotA